MHVGPLFRAICNLEMLVFVEGRKLKSPEKNPRSKAKTKKVTKVFVIETLLHRSWISVDVSQIPRRLHKVFRL